MEHYILNGHEAVSASLMQWAMWMKSADRTVVKTQIDDLTISTVFLGIDHNHSGVGAPVLFETMVFTPDNGGGDMARYCTWEEAEVGHANMVKLVETERELAGLAAGDSLAWIIVKLRNGE